jgi:hypothetical protein
MKRVGSSADYAAKTAATGDEAVAFAVADALK